MVNTENLIVVVGLGKTGISCIKHLVNEGCNVAVIDSREQPPCIDELRQKFPHIPYALGSFTSPWLDAAKEIVLSPGVSVHEPVIAKQAERGVPIIGDIELFARKVKAPVAAITGSNGKSTVTSLVGEMAKAAGIKVRVGGNLGMPALDLLDENAELYVLELSSFQLETTYSLAPAAAVILNITPDHMDRYRDLTEYTAAKQRIYHNCKAAIINRNDTPSYTGMMLPPAAKVISFGLDIPDDNNFGFDGEYLNHAKKKLTKINELPLRGLHQVANMLAALALGYAINLPFDAMLKVLREFPGLPHRCQWVAKIDDVDWYNDSKGTNVGATKAAIEGLGGCIEGKIVLIAGGLGKDADFTALQGAVAKYVRAVVLIGKDAFKIEEALKNTGSRMLHATSMHDAVSKAKEVALPKDVVLLSPACASYDMFNNFEHRGEVFVNEVRSLRTSTSFG